MRWEERERLRVREREKETERQKQIHRGRESPVISDSKYDFSASSISSCPANWVLCFFSKSQRRVIIDLPSKQDLVHLVPRLLSLFYKLFSQTNSERGLHFSSPVYLHLLTSALSFCPNLSHQSLISPLLTLPRISRN